jgi:hypothetical protein
MRTALKTLPRINVRGRCQARFDICLHRRREGAGAQASGEAVIGHRPVVLHVQSEVGERAIGNTFCTTDAISSKAKFGIEDWGPREVINVGGFIPIPKWTLVSM